jgi:tetratricopeptide (TPR) repeat protein
VIFKHRILYVLVALIIIAGCGMSKEKKPSLEHFDELFTGSGADIEKNLSALLPEAQALENKSIYLQILSQIALAQAMQQKFTQAHETLDKAELLLTPEYDLARVRILLERGRVYHQTGDIDKALPLFMQSYELSAQRGFDFHSANAAHMIAIVEKRPEDKIKWNEKAIELARASKDARAQGWLGALFNNLAQAYIQSEDYDKALSAFEQCKKYGEERGDAIVVRGSRWGIGRALRSLGRLEEALAIQQAVLAEYEEMAQKGALPHEIVVVGRGMVCEELAEIHLAFMHHYAALAYQDLSQNDWFIKLEPARLEKMKQIMGVIAKGVGKHS